MSTRLFFIQVKQAPGLRPRKRPQARHGCFSHAAANAPQDLALARAKASEYLQVARDAYALQEKIRLRHDQGQQCVCRP